MKIQILLSLLPILARLTAAVPAPDALPVPTISTTSFRNITIATPTPLPAGDDDDDDDEGDEPLPEDGNEGLLEDEEAESDFDPNDPQWRPASTGLEKRKIPTKINWVSNPNIKFKVGRRINAAVDITLRSNGNVRFYTRVNNRRRWGPYRYAIGCAVQDQAGRVFTFDRKGKVCRRSRDCHVETKDETVFNQNVRTYWKDIAKGDRIMICRAKASWNLGLVVNLALKWFKENKEGVIAVIAVITAVAAAA